MNRILALLALVSLPALVVAQAPSTSVTRVTDCAKLPDQAQRLTCFDREVAELAKASGAAPTAAATPAPRAPAAVAAPPTPAAPKSPGLLSRAKAAVGSVFNSSDSPPPAAAPVAAAPAPRPAARPAPSFGEEQLKRPIVSPDKDPDGTLAARITAVRQTTPEVYVFTLDNGQVWRQDEARYGFDPQVDDEVTVRKGSLGSYRLNLDKDGTKNWVRVTRVR